MKFKKSLGQHFLRDKRFVYKIVNCLSVTDKIVIEIGAGSGGVTHYIINRRPKELYCLEKDPSLIPLLKKRFTSDFVKIINEDILDFDISSLGNKVIVFGNIPFNISNRLIRYLIKNRSFIEKAYFTFQREFAHKLCASFNTKEYRYLSCLIQYYAKVKVIFDIPKEAFYPIPKVAASFVDIEFFEKSPFYVENESFLFELIRKVFSSRRKKIINALSGIKGKHRRIVSKALKEINLNENLRAENLSLEDYRRLYYKILNIKH